jgi:hypothetical protein
MPIGNASAGTDMSGRRPADQGLFCGVAFDRGCGHVFGLLMGHDARGPDVSAWPQMSHRSKNALRREIVYGSADSLNAVAC